MELLTGTQGAGWEAVALREATLPSGHHRRWVQHMQLRYTRRLPLYVSPARADEEFLDVGQTRAAVESPSEDPHVTVVMWTASASRQPGRNGYDGQWEREH